ncbi:flagellar type III secretion system pore protein FliP [Roseobacter sp. HKCCD9010]|uniref:flagellar type III secretion system pore protein FliP n=1 Tax=unclassified Roseobacter TaxID=196798 RepID=UPI0019FFA940|nr:flagellar type III secretion system pore protein FliP [Rhodobacterales bacterium HKCCD4356]NNV12738.1 flagellar type III secretion system pore protein FliP [Roseobacter sp. HKCCD7357]NNV16682.1 flagellar type III secretion system pore protein FliP [Roseobacter sp. HKCCD8768]NNV26686.1 flagellar type III secretion system pore protein FliP [Roseobacter sp. HKCCD8192]NNV30401.1 flagellar type III secretion system pore protein FliP [Roseobacter sp. HKCCD9061]NNV34762.1 flagellar type III secret
MKQLVAGLVVVGSIAAFAGGASAQEISLDFGDGDSLTARAVQIIALITVLSLAPGLAIMITCFPFVVTVLSILRQAIGLQQSPPNMLIVSLALFLTYFVMAPVFQEAYAEGIAPLIDGMIAPEQAIPLAYAPFRLFMEARVDPDTLQGMMALRELPVDTTPDPSILIPSFMLSEVERAFQIGFLIFLPFLIIDLVVAAILMSMGMMMVPPAIVSLPFKLAFFVVADGWVLITGALVRSYF